MQTYSHLIVTAVLNRKLKEQAKRNPNAPAQPTREGKGLPPLHSTALLIGSVAPDIPLILLTLVFILSDTLAGHKIGPDPEAGQSNVGYLFRYLFFHNRWVLTLHNLFHGPLMILFYTVAGYLAWRMGKSWGSALFWFAFSCGLHTLIDIPLHTDDGPLIFFPFYWETRFHSPLSYWDPKHYGNYWSIFEHLLIIGMLIYLLVGWWRDRKVKLSLAGG
jgi:hypothetical protein